jgi:hypothetical protein
MGGYLGGATACYGSSLGSNPDIFQKYKKGDISQRVEKRVFKAKERNRQAGRQTEQL